MAIVNIIIIVVLVIVLIWGLNNLFFKTNVIFDIMCDAKEAPTSVAANSNLFSSNKNVIPAAKIPETSSSNFMLSVWFYIDNWGDAISNEKNILFMSSTHQAVTVPALKGRSFVGISNKTTTKAVDPVVFKNINIALDQYENNLLIDIETYLDKQQSTTTSLTNNNNYTRYKIPNISVQKWNNLTLSIDTRTFDVYLDGKLRNSFILHGLYKNYDGTSAKRNIYIGNLSQGTGTSANSNVGFEGFITRIRYEGNAINPQDAYNIYKAGINSSLATSAFNKYRLKVSFLEYNKEKGSFTL